MFAFEFCRKDFPHLRKVFSLLIEFSQRQRSFFHDLRLESALFIVVFLLSLKTNHRLPVANRLSEFAILAHTMMPAMQEHHRLVLMMAMLLMMMAVLVLRGGKLGDQLLRWDVVHHPTTETSQILNSKCLKGQITAY